MFRAAKPLAKQVPVPGSGQASALAQEREPVQEKESVPVQVPAPARGVVPERVKEREPVQAQVQVLAPEPERAQALA